MFTGERRSKDDIVFEALGNTDELAANLGVAREHCITARNGLDEYLVSIQCALMDIGAHLATPRTDDNEDKLMLTEFSEDYVAGLEHVIDKLDAQLPRLTNFVLPSGGLACVHLHVARAVSRRAERSVVPLVRDHGVAPEVGRYLNRLSDFLFTAARYAAQHEGKEETRYSKAKGMFTQEKVQRTRRIPVRHEAPATVPDASTPSVSS